MTDSGNEERPHSQKLNPDTPRSKIGDDRLGLASHAEQLARTLSDYLRWREGEEQGASIVVAIEGPWGSGKSTYLNFLRHYLAPNISNDECRILHFDPWWLTSDDNLVLPFLRTLVSELPSETRGEFVKAISSLVRSSRHIPDWLIELTHNADGRPNWMGRVLKGAKESGGSLDAWMTQGKTPRAARDEAAAALLKAKMGLVVFVDDIDRLHGPEILDVLKFVKSVGDLPRVVYVLAFDREAITESLMETGIKRPAQFLEKIVQTVVPLPTPAVWRMRSLALEQLSRLLDLPIAQLGADERVDALISMLSKPRDLVRLSNNTGIILSKVAGEVDRVDFLCLQAVRLLDHPLYVAITANRALLTDDVSSTRMEDILRSVRDDSRQRDEEHRRALLLENDQGGRRERVLRSLFPLCSLWHALIEEGQKTALEGRRSVGLSRYFDTYFALEVSPGVMSRAEADALLGLTDRDRLNLEFRALSQGDPTGQTFDHLIDILETQPHTESTWRAAAVLYGRNSDFLLLEDRARSWQLGTRIARLVAKLVPLAPETFANEVLNLTASASSLIVSGPFAWHFARLEGQLGHQSDADYLRATFQPIFNDAQRKQLRRSFCAAMSTQAAHSDIFVLPGAPRLIAAWRVWDEASTRMWARDLVSSTAGLEKFIRLYNGYTVAEDTIQLFFETQENFDARMRELKKERTDLVAMIEEFEERLEVQAL